MSHKTLIEFGLTEKEAKIYVALLELEVAKISELAKKTGINRSSAYVILEELKKKELVSVSVGEGGIQKYIATSPDILLAQADDKAKKQKNIKEKIEKILPELKALHKETRNKPRVFLYTQNEAVQQAYDKLFDEQLERGMKTFRVFEDLSNVNKFLPENFIREDSKKVGAKMFVISPNNKEANEVVDGYKKFGSKDEFVLIPESRFSKTSSQVRSFSIYEDKIEFFSKDSFLIAIENRDIANLLKNLYDLAWEESKRLSATKKPKASS